MRSKFLESGDKAYIGCIRTASRRTLQDFMGFSENLTAAERGCDKGVQHRSH